jgi:LuxR family transcriptional regulator, maltose regulon positive regulatory protein
VLTEREREEMLGEIAALRAIVADYYGDSETVQHQCQLALAHLSQKDAFQQATIAAMQGLRALTSGKTVTATQRMREASALRLAAGSVGGAIHYLNMVASCLQMQGHLHEAWQVFQQTITLGTEPTGSPSVVVGGTYAYRADVLREWNQLDTALDLVLQGLRFAEKAGYTALSLTPFRSVKRSAIQWVLSETVESE